MWLVTFSLLYLYSKYDLVGLEISGMPAVVIELAKEYKIMGFPVESTHTDMLYQQFKYIPVEVLKLQATGGKRDLRDSMLCGPCSFSSSEVKYGG